MGGNGGIGKEEIEWKQNGEGVCVCVCTGVGG